MQMAIGAVCAIGGPLLRVGRRDDALLASRPLPLLPLGTHTRRHEPSGLTAHTHYSLLTSEGGKPHGMRSACSLDDVTDTSVIFYHRKRFVNRKVLNSTYVTSKSALSTPERLPFIV